MSIVLYWEMKPRRHVNKVRADETGDIFRAKVLRLLGIQSVPESLESCSWENVYNTLSSKKLADHLVWAVAHQNLCLTSLIMLSGEKPSDEIVIAAATGSTDILRAVLQSPDAHIPYQAILSAVDSGNVENTQLLLSDKRTEVVPPNANRSTLLVTAIGKINSLPLVKALLHDKRIDPSAANGAALYVAAKQGNVPVMRLLLARGADPNTGDPFVAAVEGHLDAVDLLLSRENIDLSKIPVTTLRLADQNRAKNPAVVERLNMRLYYDHILGVYLGYYTATGAVNPDAINRQLAVESALNSQLLRFVTLEKPSLKRVIEWLSVARRVLRTEDKRALMEALLSVEQSQLRGNIPLAAFLKLALGWTFQEIYEMVSRERYSNSEVLWTCLLLGGFLGYEASVASGLALVPDQVAAQAEQYTRETNFGMLRTLTK